MADTDKTKKDATTDQAEERELAIEDVDTDKPEDVKGGGWSTNMNNPRPSWDASDDPQPV